MVAILVEHWLHKRDDLCKTALDGYLGFGWNISTLVGFLHRLRCRDVAITRQKSELLCVLQDVSGLGFDVWPFVGFRANTSCEKTYTESVLARAASCTPNSF